MTTRILMVLPLIFLSACGASLPDLAVLAGGVVPAGQPKSPAPAVAPIAPSLAPASAASVALTYFSQTKSIASSGGNSVQGIGSCVVYGAATYCWDDGTHFFLSNNYTYWGLKLRTDTGALVYCPGFYGHCDIDRMASPTTMSKKVTDTLKSVVGSANRSLDEVFAHGISKTVNCTDDGSTLDCGDFRIDLNQIAL